VRSVCGSRDKNKDNRERNTIATGDLDSQPLKLQRKLDGANKRNNSSKQKQEMFVSQDKSNVRSRRHKLRAETRAHHHLLYSTGDERRGNMNLSAPDKTKHSVQFAKLQQSLGNEVASIELFCVGKPKHTSRATRHYLQ
jgi:hypothetical protein